ncbi:High-affinity branched-chain amino acid transport ATP-binding protein LivF [Pandoraea terrae]|uniref:High-affinity branched-chain amino acid transport ATP-binding protein LivF n=1 Tax=Pandoraea terrae TaxID=1537710 RepID=A0A5E4U8B2_9BURK|nr:ABC transporter ATP-binding protein [Pandoraea terrae]VVD95863.1 High-affinity branched-chain amino acid transport ATP-binding protein LivF [Pandoraea terrae]
MNEKTSLLEARGLCAGYGSIPILFDVDFAAAPGESVGILGHNGMGKTTFLRTLIGALRATTGSIRFDGAEITSLKPHERAVRGMAYVPQGRAIFSTLTAHENLRLGLYKTGRDATDAIETLLEYFPRLKRLLDRPGGSLSGGEQQLLALGRALAGNPSVLLLDEPTEGIQPSIIEEIAETLVTLRASMDLSIVLVEQNLDFIAAVSQRVLVIRRGQFVGEIPHEHLTDLEVVSQYAGVHA